MKRYEVEKDFEYRGFRCVVVFQSQGHRTGYVGLPKGHKYHGKEYNFIEDVDCHGGLTYSGGDNYPVKSDLWWIGFDTAHCYDGFDVAQALKYELIDQRTYEIRSADEREFLSNDQPKSLEYCINECKGIVNQVAE